LERYQPTAASEQDFKNLALASRVQAALVTSSKFQDLGVTVRAENGEVHVLGVFARSVSKEELVWVIKSVPGVTKVVTDCLPADLAEGLPLM
jgi:osmotically-inducible protein OsmY